MTPTFDVPVPESDPEIGPLLEGLRAAAARHAALPSLMFRALVEATDQALLLCRRARSGQPISPEDDQALAARARHVEALQGELSAAPQELSSRGRAIQEACRRRFYAHLDAAGRAVEALDQAAVDVVVAGRSLDAIARTMQAIIDSLRLWAVAAGFPAEIPAEHRFRIPTAPPGTSWTAAAVMRRVATHPRFAHHLAVRIGGV
jgi:hypothetical protein